MLGKVFGKGLNIMGQLGPRTSPHFHDFIELESLRGSNVQQVECGFLHSYFLLDSNQVVQIGYVLDNITTVRILWYYKKWPWMFLKYQKYMKYILGNTLSFNQCFQEPSALNIDLFMKVKFLKMSTGGSFLMCLDDQQTAWGMGENSKGQLGLNTIAYKGTFTPIVLPELAKAVDLACGYQHTLFADSDGKVYGCGKGNRSQVAPSIEQGEKTISLQDFYQQPVLLARQLNISKVAGGFSHSIFVNERHNKLYAMGSNKSSQCAQNPLDVKEVKHPEEIFCYFAKEEKIIDVKCGFHHTIVLTDRKAYFFGSNEHNQYPFPQLIHEDICSPVEIPIEGRPLKIFAGFDRSAVITDRNECWIFGGEDLSRFGGQDGKLEKVQLEVGPSSGVGLGYMHTLLAV